MTSNVGLGESMLHSKGKYGLCRCSDFCWENSNDTYNFGAQQFKSHLKLKVNYKKILVQLGMMELNKNKQSKMQAAKKMKNVTGAWVYYENKSRGGSSTLQVVEI